MSLNTVPQPTASIKTPLITGQPAKTSQAAARVLDPAQELDALQSYLLKLTKESKLIQTETAKVVSQVKESEQAIQKNKSEIELLDDQILANKEIIHRLELDIAEEERSLAR